MNTDRIFLTGFMGSGKSTVAPRLARGLGYKALDLDEEIVQHTGLSIPALFELYGEERFREEEKNLLRRLTEQTGIVVSLGGGAVMDPSNLAWCKQKGTLVYLKGSAAFLASRLASSRQDRPLLHDENGSLLPPGLLLDRVSDLLTQRSAIYEQAHITVTIDAASISSVVARIQGALRQ